MFAFSRMLLGPVFVLVAAWFPLPACSGEDAAKPSAGQTCDVVFEIGGLRLEEAALKKERIGLAFHRPANGKLFLADGLPMPATKLGGIVERVQCRFPAEAAGEGWIQIWQPLSSGGPDSTLARVKLTLGANPPIIGPNRFIKFKLAGPKNTILKSPVVEVFPISLNDDPGWIIYRDRNAFHPSNLFGQEFGAAVPEGIVHFAIQLRERDSKKVIYRRKVKIESVDFEAKEKLKPTVVDMTGSEFLGGTAYEFFPPDQLTHRTFEVDLDGKIVKERE